MVDCRWSGAEEKDVAGGDGSVLMIDDTGRQRSVASRAGLERGRTVHALLLIRSSDFIARPVVTEMEQENV